MAETVTNWAVFYKKRPGSWKPRIFQERTKPSKKPKKPSFFGKIRIADLSYSGKVKCLRIRDGRY
ncbi:MAG: hypothetical protein M3N10_11390 [Actinomycetota bacterium]|nr:hypothetical protein [Actinomycetota bacterium]